MLTVQPPQNLVAILASLLETCSTRYADEVRKQLGPNIPADRADNVVNKAKLNYQQGFISAIKQTRKCINHRLSQVIDQNDFTSSQIMQLRWAAAVEVDMPMPDAVPYKRIVLSAPHAESLFKTLTKAIDIVGPSDPRYDEFIKAIEALRKHQKQSSNSK